MDHDESTPSSNPCIVQNATQRRSRIIQTNIIQLMVSQIESTVIISQPTMTSATVLCSTCSTYFDTVAERRKHMHSEWHIYNMKRKINQLPPVSFHLHNTLVEKPSKRPELTSDIRDSRQRSSEHEDEDFETQDDDISNPERCLFCLLESPSLDHNLTHMSSTHGFHIPSIEALQTDIETFVAYLAWVVDRHCSCLYCGQQKRRGEAARAHMLSKGHCKLKLESGSDYLEFWDASSELNNSSQTSESPMVSTSERRLPSGAIASSRHDGRPTVKRRTQLRVTDDEEALVRRDQETQPANKSPSHGEHRPQQTQALALRDRMGMIGLSDQMQRNLAIAQRRTIAQERRNQSDARWTLEKFENRMKQRKLKMSRSGVHSATQVC